MFKKVTNLLLTIALTGWMGVANATLIFDFSLDSSEGKISGEILGLLDNVDDQSASAVRVTEIDGNTVNLGWNADDSGSWEVPKYNNFDVSDGELERIDFYYRNGDNVVRLIYDKIEFGNGYFEFQERGYDYASPKYKTGFTIANRVTVPEPDSVILVLLGLAGLSFARYRKQS
jgi:hypothetical protein